MLIFRDSNGGKGSHGCMVCLARRAAEEGEADRMFAAMQDSNFHRDLASIKDEPPEAVDELTMRYPKQDLVF